MSDKSNNNDIDIETKQSEWSSTPLGGAPDDAAEKTAAETENLASEADAAAAENKPAESESKPEEAQKDAVAGRPSGSEHVGNPPDYSQTFRSLTEGDVVDGVVVHIDKEGVLVDVGTKSEGIIHPNEISRQANLAPEDVVSVGEQISVYVMQSENQDGNLILSKKRADFERAWEKVEEAFNSGKILSAMVTDRVKGGLVVDLGIRGFIPASHVGSGNIKNLEKFVGQSLQLNVIEVDRERRKVVLSNRKVVEEERARKRQETVSTLAEGQIRGGIVRRITDYGAFVDLGGIDGLLHISEISWTRINHPSEAVKVGDKIQIMILKLNLEQGKVSLGLRQILPDPWAELEKRYHTGDVIKGTVTRTVPFGAFVQVDGGVEGIIPNSELAIRRVNKPEDVVSVGQEVEVKVVDLRPDERRMTLSLRQLQQQEQRELRRDDYAPAYNSGYSREEPKTTIADLVGEDVMREARGGRRERRRKIHEEAEAQNEAIELDEEDLNEPMFEDPTAAAPEASASVEAPAEENVEAEAVAEPVVEDAAEATEGTNAPETTDGEAVESTDTSGAAETEQA